MGSQKIEESDVGSDEAKLRIIPTKDNPLDLDVGEFGYGMIDFDRPVMGGDLEMLRTRFGLKVYDAAYLFGLNVGAFYKHTSYPMDRLETEVDRKRSKLLTDERNLELRLTKDDTITSGEAKKLESKLEKIRLELDGLCLETVISKARIKKAREEQENGRDGPDKPVNEGLALLARFYDVKEDYIDHIPLRPPNINDCMDALSFIDANDIGLLFGRDQTSSYRWRNLTNEPQPPVKRMMVALIKWLQDEPVAEDGVTPNVYIWQHVVEREFALRGREMGKVRNPSSRTMKRKVSRNVDLASV